MDSHTLEFVAESEVKDNRLIPLGDLASHDNLIFIPVFDSNGIIEETAQFPDTFSLYINIHTLYPEQDSLTTIRTNSFTEILSRNIVPHQVPIAINPSGTLLAVSTEGGIALLGIPE